MRVFCTTLLAIATALAQAPQPPAKQAEIADDTVVATVAGKKYTAGEVRALTDSLPPEKRAFMLTDPANGLNQILIFKYLESEAEKEQLDKRSPYKEDLEYQRMLLLVQAELYITRGKIVVNADDTQKYYHDHTEDFQQASVRVIYVAFSSGQVKSERKILSEPEAKAKIEDLRKKLVSGADFATLAKENSDDKDSAAKGGEWGIVKRTSNQPASVKNAIFSLKPGAVSEPVKQPNGFYLFKVDEFTTQPYDEVSSQIVEKLKQDRFDQWYKDIANRFAVKVENKDFFANHTGAPASR